MTDNEHPAYPFTDKELDALRGLKLAVGVATTPLRDRVGEPFEVSTIDHADIARAQSDADDWWATRPVVPPKGIYWIAELMNADGTLSPDLLVSVEINDDGKIIRWKVDDPLRAEALIDRAEQGLCAVDKGWCFTHRTKADYGHSLDHGGTDRD